jgi:hypothetical protein
MKRDKEPFLTHNGQEWLFVNIGSGGRHFFFQVRLYNEEMEQRKTSVPAFDWKRVNNS